MSHIAFRGIIPMTESERYLILGCMLAVLAGGAANAVASIRLLRSKKAGASRPTVSTFVVLTVFILLLVAPMVLPTVPVILLTSLLSEEI